MTRPVLLVSIAPKWIGTARIPRTLAGFEASVLTCKNSLARHYETDIRGSSPRELRPRRSRSRWSESGIDP